MAACHRVTVLLRGARAAELVAVSAMSLVSSSAVHSTSLRNRIYTGHRHTQIKMQVCSEKAAAILSRFQVAKDLACGPAEPGKNHYCNFRGCERTQNKPFATRKGFLDHQRSVHSTKSQVCNCGKKFTYRNELKRHKNRIFAREKGCLGA